MTDSNRPTYLSTFAIAALLLGVAQAPLQTTMFAVALASIANDLAVDLALATSLLVTAFIIIAIIVQGPSGKIADIMGRWLVFDAGVVVLGAGAVLGTLAPSLQVAVGARAL